MNTRRLFLGLLLSGLAAFLLLYNAVHPSPLTKQQQQQLRQRAAGLTGPGAPTAPLSARAVLQLRVPLSRQEEEKEGQVEQEEQEKQEEEKQKQQQRQESEQKAAEDLLWQRPHAHKYDLRLPTGKVHKNVDVELILANPKVCSVCGCVGVYILVFATNPTRFTIRPNSKRHPFVTPPMLCSAATRVGVCKHLGVCVLRKLTSSSLSPPRSLASPFLFPDRWRRQWRASLHSRDCV